MKTKSLKKSNDKVVLNIRLPKFLMEKVNVECDRLGMNKTSYVIMILNSYFDGLDMLRLSRINPDKDISSSK